MRTTRTLVVVGCVLASTVAAPVVARSAASATHTRHAPQRTRTWSTSQRRALAASAFSVARLQARSPQAAAQRMMPFALDALGASGPPTVLESLYGAQCNIDEGGASGSGGVSSPSAEPSADISLNKEQFSELVPAGDLDGVSGTDVLDFRLTAHHQAIDAGVTARSGATGAELWSRTLSGGKDQFTFPFVEPDLVGGSATPGALLVNDIEPLFALGTSPATLTVEAVDGAGTQTWSQTLTGQITTTTKKSTLTDVPIVIGDINNTATGGHDLLVDVLSGTFNNAGEKGTDQPEIISAATGEITPIGLPFASTVSVPEVVPVPDLSGDGIDDVAAIIPGKNGAVVAERSDTGAQLWSSTNTTVAPDAAIASVGNVSSPDVPDLVLISDPFSSAGDAGATLIDGANGVGKWTHTGACAFEIDKAGPKLQPAVGLVSSIGERDGSHGATLKAVVTPRSKTGKVIYKRTIADVVTSHKAVHHATYEIHLGPIGDVQADGSQDLIVAMKASAGKKHKSLSGVISGKTGRLISTPGSTPADGSLRSGAAVDLLDVTRAPSGVKLSAYRGATGTRYYARHVAGTKGLKPGPTYGIRVSGHDCSDLAFAAQSATGALIGLYTASGDPIWTVASTAKQLTGGTVTVSPTPATYCLS